MYFLILKKGVLGRGGKGYTDMYVQPNVGTPLKQPISTSENKL